MVTGLLLVVSVLAFAGLAYQTVPIVVPYTNTDTFISFQFYTQSSLTEVAISTAATTPTQAVPEYDYVCYSYDPYGNCVSQGVEYLGSGIPAPYTVTIGEVMWTANTISYAYPATSFVTGSSTINLTGGSFPVLALIVVGFLTLLTAYLIMRPKIIHRPQQVTVGQPVEANPLSINCGAELPPASDFCNKCGTKQT